jgi:hypothetical protein
MGKELGIEGSGRARNLAPFELKDFAGPTGTISLTPNEKRVAEDRRDCYWLYVVSDCDTSPRPQIIKDPASLPWHEACLPCHHASRRRQGRHAGADARARRAGVLFARNVIVAAEVTCDGLG